jgi:hypothetical protein
MQVANASQKGQTINAARILLRDTDGFTYQNQNVWISECLATFVYLLPGEVWWYELEFEIPASRRPEALIVPLDLFESSSARVPVLQSPRHIATQGVRYLSPSSSADLGGLRWSLESVLLDAKKGVVSLVLVMRNTTTKAVSPDVNAPYVADCKGRLAGVADASGFSALSKFPSEVKPGEVFRIPLSFSVTGLQSPFYLFVGTGLTQMSKTAWRIVDSP